MVSVTSASRYATSASRHQSRSWVYIRGLNCRNSTELAKAVPIGFPCGTICWYLAFECGISFAIFIMTASIDSSIRIVFYANGECYGKFAHIIFTEIYLKQEQK